MSEEIRIGPASKPQELFLTLRDGVKSESPYSTEDGEEVDIIFYGGQAGGGKTMAALIHHLKYYHLPNYKGLIIRRTTPMLTKPGAVWDEARSTYKLVDPDARIRHKDMKINFGPVEDQEQKAEVSFTHFERADDTDNFQGSQISSVVFDELCQFEESQFLYVLSRLRTKAKMKPVARATMNPDPDSWVKKWVSWYLYPEGHPLFGRPDPAKQAVVRWFIRNGNDMVWAESLDEMMEKHGRKDEYGKLYPREDKRQIKPLSFSFISASVYDNPYIEPSYIAFLEGLTRVEKEILLYGSWEARPEGSGFFKREWVEELLTYPDSSEFVKIVRAYDLAGSLVSDVAPDPDYSVGVKMGKTRGGMYVILDVIRFRARHGDVMLKILETARSDGSSVDIEIPSDPNSAAKAAATMMVKEIASHGYYCRARPSNKSKIDRFKPFAAVAQHGLVQIVKGCVDDLENKTYRDNSPYYSELEKFDGGRKGHDDMVDATSSAFMALATGLILPSFSLPDMKQDNPFNI